MIASQAVHASFDSMPVAPEEGTTCSMRWPS